ncbi:MAG: serine/threonine-protein kinase HipA [Pseudonocardiales bacterium]|nr:serine/threonine-protein kinase HipA [Pseudonocardiales bacterium]
MSVPAGTLYSHRRRGTETASFSYDNAYLADPRGYPLDPALPLVSGTLQAAGNQKIFGAFFDSCPDRWGQRLIERAESRRVAGGGTPRSFGQFDLLLRVRDDLRQGAIRFAVNDEFVADDTSGVPVMTDLPTLLSAADDVANADTDDGRSLALLLRAGSSLGGARPKAHVRDHNGRIAIAKFPSPSDSWNVMAWEATALDLAAKAQIAVPTHHLESIGGRNVLIVDRFDRIPSGLRRGYMSIMTALEASDGEVRSYVDIAEALEERSSQVIRDLTELWRRIIFSILISNTDDHLRNHALLHVQAGTWTLSPAFDLNPNPAPGPKHLSTAIDGDTLADVRNALAVAPLFRLDADQARDVLRQVRNAVTHWREVATHHGLNKSDLAAMAPAFEHAQAAVAEQLLAA